MNNYLPNAIEYLATPEGFFVLDETGTINNGPTTQGDLTDFFTDVRLVIERGSRRVLLLPEHMPDSLKQPATDNYDYERALMVHQSQSWDANAHFYGDLSPSPLGDESTFEITGQNQPISTRLDRSKVPSLQQPSRAYEVRRQIQDMQPGGLRRDGKTLK